MLAALLLSMTPVAVKPVSGLYLADQMEVAAGLELRPDGRFRYALDYGAVSEGAEGRWSADATTVRLTSDAPREDAERSSTLFQAQALHRHGDLLLLERHETVIRFRKLGPEGK